MDEKMQKEVEAMLAEEREKMVKQQSLVSWLRAWFWLMLVEKKNAGGWYKPTARRIRTPFWARLRSWFSRPFRAWAVYRWAKLDRELQEKLEDDWLNRTLKVLREGGAKVPRQPAAYDKSYAVEDCPFVQAIQSVP
jgi:hypothetical protein